MTELGSVHPISPTIVHAYVNDDDRVEYGTTALAICPDCRAQLARCAGGEHDTCAANLERLALRGPEVCAFAMITYRQLDYWARTELLVPSLHEAHGSGSQRLYAVGDARRALAIKRFLDFGVSLGWLRSNIDAALILLAVAEEGEPVSLPAGHGMSLTLTSELFLP